MATKKRPRKPTATPKPNSAAHNFVEDPPPVGPITEFRQPKDDAWYSVNLVLKGETLVVKYREFTADFDLEFHAKDFTTHAEVIKFGLRFRPLNQQLEPCDCGSVRVGDKVCALKVFSDSDHRYYDALIEAVEREEHTFDDGNEKCPCIFVLSWLHGPEVGTLTPARVEDLCPVQSRDEIDLRLACFLQIAKWKHGITSPDSGLYIDEATTDHGSPISPSKLKPLRVLNLQSAARAITARLNDEEKLEYGRNERDEDADMGGGSHSFTNVRQITAHGSIMLDRLEIESALEGKVSDEAKEESGHYPRRLTEGVVYVNAERSDESANEKSNPALKGTHYYIQVENLEKDLSPLTIVDFIRRATSLEIKAYVSLSLPSDPYTRGALVVNSEEKLEKLCNFVFKPDQMIISSRGRPWVTSEFAGPHEVTTPFWCLDSAKKVESSTDQLKTARPGSEDYRKAEKIYNLYRKFSKNQVQLFERYSKEEQKILGA